MELIWDGTPERSWQRLTARTGAAMQQDWAYGAACAALGSRVMRAEVVSDGRTRALAQLVHRRFFGCLHAVVCTRGPVWLTDDGAEQVDVIRALRRALPLPWLRGLFVTPDTHDPTTLRSAGLDRVMTPYATAVLDLTRPAEDLRAAMHQKWRNRLRQAERAALTVRRADTKPEAYRWLMEQEAQQQRAKRYVALPPTLPAAWQQGGGALRVYTAEAAGTPIAAMMFLIHGRRATYHIGWSHGSGKQVSAHNLILWKAMRKLRRAGVEELDLGGLNTEDAAGIARFKLGSGAQLKTLCGTWFGR
ncbi:MAG: GNAT family N-acetyltransferase [Pseudomonadota bacterium]